MAYKLVVFGGSAGSLEVILSSAGDWPVQSGAAFVIVLHRKADGESLLADILSDKTRMPVKEVEDKDALLPNVVYIAPGGYHLLFETEAAFSLDSSEKINHSRPSIDVTFESAAEVFGEQCIGVLLSGANADGAEGLLRLKRFGGYTIVQEPSSAEVGYMPQQAINKKAHRRLVAAAQIGTVLKALLTAEAPAGKPKL